MSTDEHMTDAAFQALLQHLDELVQEFEALPLPAVREQVFDLLQTVDAIHRAGLSRLLGSLREQGQVGQIDRAARDPIVQTLLLLYDLVPADERSQVETALMAVRPYLHAHGGEVEVLDVVDGVVHLRLSGACQGCAGQAMTLRRGIEAALQEGFRGFRSIQVHEPARGAAFIPLDQLGGAARQVRRPVFTAVAQLAEVPPGTLRPVTVDGVPVMLANVDGEVYAVRDQCPGSVAPLHLGVFAPPVVTCPWHDEAYDVRTGKRADGGAGSGLTVLPIAVVDGVIQLAVNTLPAPAPVARP